MRFARFFIDRPIFATVLSVFILVVGALAFFALPVAQYPEIAPPTVVVTANYPGANAETIAATVATPLEQEINGVDDMLYMYSQSTANGVMQLTITFKLGTDLDEAQVLVQNRVAIAEPRLPEEVRRQGITTRKSSPDLLMVVHMLSPDNSLDQLYISNYALLQVRDVLSRVDGVGSISVFGARDYSMRVWLDPDLLAARGLVPSDVVAALQAQNVQVAGGTLGRAPVEQPTDFEISLQLQGRLTSVAQFEDIIVRTSPEGRVTRLKDVARVELGAQEYVTNSYLSGSPAVALAIFQRPGSNALATAEGVQQAMQELEQGFPQGLGYRVIYNPTDYIQQSIDELLLTVWEAIALVVLVVLLFLQTWRASIIPVIAIPVSLIGTLAVMAALGFSINNLTLFGLVLAVGIVVDDAIVVVENIERNLRAGLSPKEAARKTMDEVGSALISIALVLSAVFIPTAFISGISGQFYQQFAVTIAVATVISAFNSLTLSPALGALLLKEHGSGHDARRGLGRLVMVPVRGFFTLFNRGFDAMSRSYSGLVRLVTSIGPVMLVLYAGLIGGGAYLFMTVPTGFIPQQDQGYLITVVQLPPGASLARTNEVVRRAEETLLNTPGIDRAATFAGFNGATFTTASNAGVIFAGLTPFEERLEQGLTADAILADAQQRLFAIQEGMIFIIPPPPVRGIGTAGGFKMMVQDRRAQGVGALNGAATALMGAAMQDGRLAAIFTPFQINVPQLYVDVDRTKAQQLNVPLAELFETLQAYIGSIYVNDFNLFGRTYRVTVQGDAPYRLRPADVARLKVRSSDGAMVPLGSLVEFRDTAGPDRVPRYNLYPAIEVQGQGAPGISSGQALEIMAGLAEEVLPDGIGFEWTELSYQQTTAGNTAFFIFPLCVFFVFLVLAAQYESWSLPLAIILIVPMCLLSAIGGVMLRGQDNNILTQIGFVVLVGLASKNAILIVEFARQLEEQGRDRFQAAVEACRLRLRPILMTSFAFILGVVPLMTASGAGAEMRQAIGTAVFFGMLGVTFFGLIFTPVFYVLIRGWLGGRKAASKPATESA